MTQRARERLEAALRLEAQGLAARAERAYRAILEIAPREATALARLGLLLCARGEFARGAPLLWRACQANPKDPTSWMNLAACRLRLGDAPGALDAYGQAVAADPASRDARLNLAYRLRSEGRLAEARAHYEDLVRRRSTDGLARWNLAALDGLAGDLDAAFKGFAHEHAMKAADLPDNLPRWAGEPLAGRRVLLEAEQGLGDTLMFARLARLVRDAGGRVILRAQPELAGLFRAFDGVEVYAPRNQPAPAAEVWFPLADLPAVLGIAPSLAAAPGAYLAADPARCALWRDRLPNTDRLRVALVWAGGPAHAEDRNRSMPLAVLLEALAAIEGVEWVSLQKGPAAAEADGTALLRADLDIGDFEDTAAALTRVDLAVCVDTSVLHLAGALGRPVWGLIAHIPDWRWMLGRTDSPWYPSLRLFRQPKPGDWRAVAHAVASALEERARRTRH
jgi:hypothetical protein